MSTMFIKAWQLFHIPYSFSLFVDQTVSFLHHYIHVIYCSYKNYNLATNTVFPWILIATPQIFIPLPYLPFLLYPPCQVELKSTPLKAGLELGSGLLAYTPVDFEFFFTFG